LGRKFNEPEVQEFAKQAPYRLVELPNKQIGFEVMYANEKKVFSDVAITAMLLNNLKGIAERGTGKPCKDVVISVPGFWTEHQRQAMLDAAVIANLNPLRLLNDHTASALQYGIYKKELSDTEPIRVMFVDIGESNTTVSIVEFLKGKLKVLAVAFDRTLGGRCFDQVLVDHFAKEFQEKYKIDIKRNQRALIRLQVVCEKLKKVLNTVPEAPINIDSIMNDVDVRGMMKRADYEAMVQPLLERLLVTVKQALSDFGQEPDKLFAVEITGGATRYLLFKVD